jgi:hypothetical protein
VAELINGDGTIPQATSGYVQHAISSSTNAAPIAVTFAAPHGFNEGDTIAIEGHLVNTAANATWRVHVTGASTVTLVGSTGNGVGVATGYAIDYSVNPLIQVPDDGDAASGSNLNTATSGVFNFVPYLYQRAGKYRLYDRVVVANGSNLVTAPAGWTTQGPFADSTWTTCTGTENAYANVVAAGDYLVVDITATDDSAVATAISYAVTFSINGGAYALGGAFDGIGTPATIQQTSSAKISFTARYEGPVHTASLPTNAGGLSIALAAMQKSGGSASIGLAAPYSIVVSHYRSNA